MKITDNSNVNVRSNHNLSFNWLGSADFGRIVPFHVQELIGSDKVIRCKPRIEMQMLPLVSPTFGKIDIYAHYFFVPTRLLWRDFNDFYTQTGEGQGATPPAINPGFLATMYALGFGGSYEEGVSKGTRPFFKHWTSLGLPPFFACSSGQLSGIDSDPISVLPFRAYNQIWWDFYRDPELLPDSNKSIYLDDSSGLVEFDVDGTSVENRRLFSQFMPKSRSIKDNWIAELFARNGSEGYPAAVNWASSDMNPGLRVDAEGRAMYARNLDGEIFVKTNIGDKGNSVIGSYDARRVEALVRMAERMSLGGKRQIDQFFAQYGVKPEYNKLQMCQYLGGAKKSVLVSDITATADTVGSSSFTDNTSGSPLGRKAGAGYCAFEDLNIEFTAAEPGYLMGVFSVVPRIHFVQGLGKEWYRNDRYDWFHKELEHVGQVAVPRKEIGFSHRGQGSNAVLYDNTKNNETFAFTQPYYDYKRKMDVIAGDFAYYKNNATQSADVEDLVYDMAYMNSLGLYVDYPTDREYTADNMLVPASKSNQIFYYQGGDVWSDADDHFHLDIDVDCLINRPMDGYAVPSLETTDDPHLSKQNVGSSTVL